MSNLVYRLNQPSFRCTVEEGGIKPSRAHPSDAGFDLFTPFDVEIAVGERILVKTKVHVALPDGSFGFIAGKSGLALRSGIIVLGGIVDSSYRGEVGVILYNSSSTDAVSIPAGKAVAQFIPIDYDDRPIAFDTSLDDTDRGSGGFGSTNA